MSVRSRSVSLLILAVALALLTAWTPSDATARETGPDPVSAGSDKIEPALEKTLTEQDTADFWVAFTAEADTGRAEQMRSWGNRGRFVVDELRSTAQQSQVDARQLLEADGAAFTSYWVTNAIHVEAGDHHLAQLLARDPAVQRIFPPVKYAEPEPIDQKGTGGRLGAQAESVVEWGVGNIKADQVWQQYGVRGDGIVVASIDSGVQFDHPALVDSYRGYDAASGQFSNDYNWFDVSGIAEYPTDDNGHGTHTMGTMVGDDGGANQIGVAPGARWISANGCCPSDEALIASAQWMLAPTKVDGSAPDPAKRPDIINNSWGSTEPSTDPFMEDILESWAASGIFGVWANGNLGTQGCGSASSPGSRGINYSVGAYDAANQVAPFSGRGPGQDGEVKPNISAPGVQVRSSVPGSRYALFSGTSMATPHVAGAIALLWSAQPSLVGDIPGTRELLDQTATDSPDGSCGGTDADNNVYGEGRLDALALVQAAPQEETGTITGTISAEETGEPVRGATIRLDRTDLVRSARTGDDGGYLAEIPTGTYHATVTAFGFEPVSVDISVTAGATTDTDITLAGVAGFTVSGRVLDQTNGSGIPFARVTLAGTRFATTTDADGGFAVEHVPGPADYLLSVDAGGCTRAGHRSVTVQGDTEIAALRLPRVTDQPQSSGWGYPPSYGYSCEHEPTQWIEGADEITIPGIRDSSELEMPFDFTYFGRTYDHLLVDRYGVASFWLGKQYPGSPHYLVDGMLLTKGQVSVDDQTRMLTRTTGKAPNRAFTVEWRDVTNLFQHDVRFSFEVTLHEDGDVVYAYKDIDQDNLIEVGAYSDIRFLSHGADPSLTYEFGLDYSIQRAIIDDRRQIRFELPPNGWVAGRVTDRQTGAGVPGADVDLVNQHGNELVRVETDDDGRYRIQAMTERPYTIRVADAPGYYVPAPVDVRLTTDGQVLPVQTQLEAGTFRLSSSELTVRPGRSTQLTIRNTGRAPLRWRAETRAELPDRPAPGTQVSGVATGVGIQLGVEEVDGLRWVSAVNYNRAVPWVIAEVTEEGQPTGKEISATDVAQHYGIPAERLEPSDLAWVPSRGWMCTAPDQVDDVVCLDPDTSEVVATIPTGFGTDANPSGLAYDTERDLFFVLGNPRAGRKRWYRTLTGFDHPDPGREVGSCRDSISSAGLAWDPASRSLWTKAAGGTLRQVDPITCTEISTVQPQQTTPGSIFRVSDVDADGDLLTVFALRDVVGEFVAGDPTPTRVPGVTLSAWEGTVDRGRTGRITIDVDDESQLPEDLEELWLVLRGNGGAKTKVVVPVAIRR